MEETPLQRMELLIQKEGIERLKQACVMVVGVGGVGSYAAEALARCGIGTLILVDGDTVAISNLNRQIHATYETLHQSKTKVMKERIETYRKIVISSVTISSIMQNQNELLFQQPVDFCSGCD